MAKIIGVGSVFIRSPDPDGLYAWYSRCLGQADLLEVTTGGGGSPGDPLLWSIVDGDPQSLDHVRRVF